MRTVAKRIAPEASEFVAKCGEETAYWLELLIKAKIVAAARFESLQKEADEPVSIFVAI